jgi:hypothetical protein
MTDASTTARAVLDWAARPNGALPVGGLGHTDRLAGSVTEAHVPLQTLARTTAARLGAGRPPLGDPGPVGLGAVLLATAVGGRLQPEAATSIVDATPRRPAGAGYWFDCLARHGVVAAAVRHRPAPVAGRPATPAVGDDLADALLRASPLSAVLVRPNRRRVADGATANEAATAIALLRRPRGRAVLTGAVAAPDDDVDVLRWRRDLLDRLRLADLPDVPALDVVLDVYVIARLWYGPEWDEYLRTAHRRLVTGERDELATATVGFWAPLAALRRDHPARLEGRPYLLGHERALELVHRHGLV